MKTHSGAKKRFARTGSGKLVRQLSPLLRAMFIDTNPIPVKKAVELRGMAGGPVRLPLDELDEAKTKQLREVLACYD